MIPYSINLRKYCDFYVVLQILTYSKSFSLAKKWWNEIWLFELALPKIWTMKSPKFFSQTSMKCIAALGCLDLSGSHCTYFVEFLKEMVLLFKSLTYLPYVHWVQHGFTNSVIFLSQTISLCGELQFVSRDPLQICKFAWCTRLLKGKEPIWTFYFFTIESIFPCKKTY